jgi:hypothetical protein
MTRLDGADVLDRVAHREFKAERATHAANYTRIAHGDADAFLREFERHIDRVTAITDACGRRRRVTVQ